MKRSPLLLAALPALLFSATLAAASHDDGHAQHVATAPAPAAAAPARADRSPVRRLPLVVVHKSPTCGCCGKWVDHLRAAGFPVEVREVADLGPVKARVGVPPAKGSCHTAEVGGYFVEGHVPAEDVRRLLAEKPKARGLTVPAMPIGSPGMEVPSGEVQPYAVLLVRQDGSTVEYARHGGGKAHVHDGH
jgi:hypothetical protein